MSDETQTATIGHNNPPTLFTPEELAADLAAACLELIDPRSKELTDSFDRWKKATSLPVRDADDRPMHDPTTGDRKSVV